MKVKIFSATVLPTLSFLSKPIQPQDGGLEAKINDWLATNPNIRVHNIEQSMSGGSWRPGTLFISMWYE